MLTMKNRSKSDLETTLRRAWCNLRLSVRDPGRVPTWNAVVLTAASPEQAELYTRQLERAKRIGRIAPTTVTLAVPDPQGERIGSGAATLNAILALAKHLYRNSLQVSVSRTLESIDNEIPLGLLMEITSKRHVLLLHAGGDSKRVPWANPMGKVFLPLPYLATDDPDDPVPLLFDHILAIASCARQSFQSEGGLFIMTGDVLPCFNAFNMVLPEDAASIVTVPITLDIAFNHGVVVASKSGPSDDQCSVSLVNNLLQKPSIKELVENQALLDDGRALLDTGIIAVKGKAWVDLVALSCSCQYIISNLLNSKKELSLYEDLVAAWVPTKHEWLKSLPLGEELVTGLGNQPMFSYCAYDLLFLHFGTSSEVLDHLTGTRSELVGRRHLCSIPATAVSDIAPSSILISCKIAAGVSIGEDSLVYDSCISSGIQIGSQSIVVGVNIPEQICSENSFMFMLPNRHCLWEVPLVGHAKTVIVYCGLYDNPKNSASKDGTFCGRPWKKVLGDLGIEDADLWETNERNDKFLWNAKLFPILSYSEMLLLASWLMGLSDQKDNTSLQHLWRRSDRKSLEELHRSIDFSKMWRDSSNHHADLAVGIVTANLKFGLLGRNLCPLLREILQNEDSGVEICKQFLSFSRDLLSQSPQILPKSRIYQLHLDLLIACNDKLMASEMEHKVWAAVVDETTSAVNYGFRENLFRPLSLSPAMAHDESSSKESLDQSFHCKKVIVELPVRVDFSGGWSDTPPWSLERSGCVLNMAITLEGSLPVGTIVETTCKTGLWISDDMGNELHIDDFSSISLTFDSSDIFRLVKSAVIVTGIVNDRTFQSMGLKIKTWANVPRGSGLGTSSILSAAVVKGLLQVSNGDDSDENVTRLVLVLEQLMGTGGGWQDQIGGLYPGIKFTASFPGIPLRLQVIPLLTSPRLVNELRQRLLVVFTGHVRVAHQVLQKVVTRYLQRDNLLVSSIRRLIELAKIGREALMNCEIDVLGDVMLEAWRLHQELDPYCSNEFVDKLFAFSEPYCNGYKLVGAGGGGFSLLLAKSADSASKLRHLLHENDHFNVEVYNWDIYLPN